LELLGEASAFEVMGDVVAATDVVVVVEFV